MSVRSPESRRIASLLRERRVSGAAMVAVLSVALLCGLVGFALHTMWVVSIVVLALGRLRGREHPPGSQRGHRTE